MTTPRTDRTANEAASDLSLSAPQVTVAICTRNRAAFLEKAVQSVLRQITDDTEILIVDNASTDETPEVASRLANANPGVALYRENELGLSAARNAALVRARGQYVIFLDDDAQAEPGWLESYRRFLISPSAGRIAVLGGPVFPDYEVAPPKWLGAGANQLDLGGTPKRVSALGGPWGGNSAYRRDAALQAGMFDTRLGRKGSSLAAHEESDLNLRLLNAGYEIWWLPGAGIRHFVPASRLSFRWVGRFVFSEGRSAAIMRRGSFNGRARRALFRSARLLAAPFQIAICLLAAVVMLPRRHRRATAGYLLRASRIAGFAWGLLAG